MSWSAVRSRPSISAWCITRMTSSLGTSVDSQITTLPTGPFHVQYVHIYIYYVICILYLYIICPLHVHSCFAGFYTNLAYGILPLSSWSVVLKKNQCIAQILHSGWLPTIHCCQQLLQLIYWQMPWPDADRWSHATQTSVTPTNT